MAIREIRRALVVGAGTMGHGIAQVVAEAGIETRLHDVAPDLVERGLAQVRQNLEKGIQKGKVDPAHRDRTLGLLAPAPADLDEAAREADLLVEAVPERLDLKQQLFERLGRAAPEGALLATNTSSLPVARIAEASARPAAVVGLHFFNPVHLMKLLEVIHTSATSAEALDAARALGERLGKTVIVVKDSPGFATSRLGLALGLEAMRMVEEGVARPEDIDRAMKLGYGHPVGPLELTDRVGLDVRLSIAEFLAAALDDRRFEPPAILRRLVAEGKLGRKSGEGFFSWPDVASPPAGS